MKDVVLSGTDLYEKVEKLKIVQVDSVNWCTYYIDVVTAEKWIEEYPNSEYHGGGAPVLRLLHVFP